MTHGRACLPRSGWNHLQVCVPGGDKRRGEGFAKADAAALWQVAKIPAIIVEFADSIVVKNNLM